VKSGKTVLVYSQSDLVRDPRVHRQIELLSGEYNLVVFGNTPPKAKVAKFYDLVSLIGLPENRDRSKKAAIALFRRIGLKKFIIMSIRQFLKSVPIAPALQAYWDCRVVRGNVIRRIRKTPCDLIIANDYSGLAVCAAAKGKRKLLYDAHEYTPGQFPRTKAHLAQRTHARYVIRKNIGHCDMVMTIGDGIARLYERMFGAHCEVVTNAPAYRDLSPSRGGEDKIRLVHHGVAAKNRDLEKLIDMMGFLDEKFSLDFYLVPFDEVYYSILRSRARDNPRISFHEPVDMLHLPEELHQYDIGCYLFNPNCINIAYALPNKFFEFVQARLAIAIGPVPEMGCYVKKYGLGVVSEDFEPKTMARVLSRLDRDAIMEFKRASDARAWELSSEPNARIIKRIVAELLEGTT